MGARTRYGIRKIEPVEGGLIAWLHPGGADIDEVLLEVAREWSTEEDWTDREGIRSEGPDPEQPAQPWEGNEEAWSHYLAHRPPYVWRIREDHPTRLLDTYGSREPSVGYYRRMPWCHCGEDHTWHFEESTPGPGASLAVLVGGAW